MSGVHLNVTNALVLSLILGSQSCEARIRRPAMPPAPAFLQNSGTIQLTDAVGSEYRALLSEGERLYAEGRAERALERFGQLDARGASLLSIAQADLKPVGYRLAAVCWQVGRPLCAARALELADTAEARDAAKALRSVFSIFYRDEIRRLESRQRYVDGCLRRLMMAFDDSGGSEDPTYWLGDEWLYDPHEATRQCLSEAEEPLPAPVNRTARVEDAVAMADWSITRRRYSQALQPAVDARFIAQQTKAFLERQGHDLLIAKANSHVLLKNFEDALTLFETWLRDESARPTKSDPAVERQTKSIIMMLRGALALKYFQAGLAAIDSSRWLGAIDAFQRAETFLPIPATALGIGTAHIMLDTGSYSPFMLGETELEQAVKAFKEYLVRAPDASNRAAVQAQIVQIQSEIERRRQAFVDSGANAMGMAMAGAVMAAVNDMQRQAHDFVVNGRADLWGGARNYVQFGGDLPTQVVIGGRPVPTGGSRSPASDPGAMGHVFTQLSVNQVPPVSVLPVLPPVGSDPSIPQVFVGRGRLPPTPTGQSPAPFTPQVVLPPMAQLREMQAGRTIDARSLRPGDLIVSRAHTVVSTATRIYSGSDVSHVMLYVGHGQIIEAVGEGVKLTPLAEAVTASSYAMAMRNTQLNNPQAAIDFAFSKLGAKYNTWGLILHPRFGVLARLDPEGGISPIGRAQYDAPRVTDRYFCSQLVLDAYKAANAPSFIESQGSSPGDFSSFGFLDGVKYVGHLNSEPVTAGGYRSWNGAHPSCHES